MKKFLVLLLLARSVISFAQKQITVEDITVSNTFAQKSITGINWMKEGKFYTSLGENKILKYNITTGEVVETLLDGAQLSPKIDIQSYSLSEDEKKILLLTERESIYRRSYKAEFFVYDLATKSLKKL